MTAPSTPGHDIVVVAASAGGVETLQQLVRGLPADYPGAVFIVLHIPPGSASVLPAILSRAGALPAVHPADGEPIRPGHIYVAPADRHLLVERGHVRLSRGPRENSVRPAADPMMRTAARAYGARVVGVVLSGNLDDGTAGLMAVKVRGGVTVVQDPAEALFDGMPRSAVEGVQPDHVLPLARVPALLVELAARPAPHPTEDPLMPDETDDAIAFSRPDHPPIPPEQGAVSAFTCPECHGTLWEMHEGELLRFRCRVGHRYSAETLLAEQHTALEAALWTALRALEESAAFRRRLARRAAERGNAFMAERYTGFARETEQRAVVIRDVLLRGREQGARADEGAGDTAAIGIASTAQR